MWPMAADHFHLFYYFTVPSYGRSFLYFLRDFMVFSSFYFLFIWMYSYQMFHICSFYHNFIPNTSYFYRLFNFSIFHFVYSFNIWKHSFPLFMKASCNVLILLIYCFNNHRKIGNRVMYKLLKYYFNFNFNF